MIVFFYEKVRLKRGAWQTVSIVLLIAFLCAFFTLFDGFICQKEQDMESAYAVIPVTVVVSNLTGTKTDDLKITDYIINYFLSESICLLQPRDGFFESAKADWHYFC